MMAKVLSMIEQTIKQIRPTLMWTDLAKVCCKNVVSIGLDLSLIYMYIIFLRILNQMMHFGQVKSLW